MQFSKVHFVISSFFLILVGNTAAFSAYTFQGGRLINNNELSSMSVQEHYSAAVDAYQKKDWEELIHQATIIYKNFPSTPFANESVFYLGVAYFHLKEYEMANKEFSAYLKRHATPKNFEEAIKYKFAIAEKFQSGSKKRVLGWESMPKIIPAQEDALEIYEEVIAALPHDDLAAKALYGKAKLFFKEEEYKSSVEAFQTIIRRFPKNPLAAESYIGIAEVYLSQCQKQYPDPDFLDLAEINLRKFRLDFPGEERIGVAEKMLLDMQEVYAQSLYDTGQFFERTKKPHASIIYYNKILSHYPDTKIAKMSQKKLEILQEKTNKKRKKSASSLTEGKSEKMLENNPTQETAPDMEKIESEMKNDEELAIDKIIGIEESRSVERNNQQDVIGFEHSKASLIEQADGLKDLLPASDDKSKHEEDSSSE